MRQGKIIASLLAVGLALGVAQEGQAADNGLYSAAEAMGKADTAQAQPMTPVHQTPIREQRQSEIPSINNLRSSDDDIFEVASLSGQIQGNYHLAPYDVIDVNIVGFTDGSQITEGDGMHGVVIGPDGKANLPYIGQVDFSGLTLQEAQAELSDRFSEYLRFPSLFISIRSYAPRKVYVTGEVRTPGIQQLSLEAMNAYAAITSAGGATNRGRTTLTEVIRIKDGVMYHRRLNIKDFIKKHDISQNVQLEDGDIVYVPDTNGIKFNEDILPYINVYGMYRALTRN